MTEQQLAYINPKILKWARNDCGFSLEEAVKSDLNPEKLEKAEQGEVHLTYKQFLKIARRYRRPPAFFYLKNPPEEHLLDDFRTLESKETKFSPVLRDEFLKIKEKRSFAIKFKDYDKEYEYNYVNSISTDDQPIKTALKIRNLLAITLENQRGWKEKYEAFNSWKSSIEKIGILIFQLSGIELSEMRGFSISEIPYPVIGLNRKDSPFGRIFTLIHELCHIMIKRGGICTIQTKDEEHYEIEKFCNSVAGKVLIPTESFNRFLKDNDLFVKKNWSDDTLDKISRIYWVSKEVILRKLLDLNLTTPKYYNLKRNQWKKGEKEKKSFQESQFRKVLTTQSNNYIKIVINALNNNQITYHDLSFYLNMNLKHLDKLINNFPIQN